jgi:hypothetical protein
MQEHDWSARCKAALDSGCLDPGTERRLREARHRALEQYAAGPGLRHRLFGPLPLAVAFSLVLGLSLLIRMEGTEVPEIQRLAADDMELMLDDTQLGLLEDLEFYQWLTEADLDAG